MKQRIAETTRDEITKWPKWKKQAVVENFNVSVESITAPPTWNDAINAMSAEEKSHAIMNMILVVAMDTALCSSEIEKILNSPYDGGKAQEGAE